MRRFLTTVSIASLLASCHGQPAPKKNELTTRATVLLPKQVTICSVTFGLPPNNVIRFDGSGASGQQAMADAYRQCGLQRFGDRGTVCVPQNEKDHRCSEFQVADPIQKDEGAPEFALCQAGPAPAGATAGSTFPPDQDAHAEHQERTYPYHAHDFYSTVPARGSPPFPAGTKSIKTWCRVSISNRFDWCAWSPDDVDRCPWAMGKSVRVFRSDGGWRVTVGFTNYSEDENREVQVFGEAK